MIKYFKDKSKGIVNEELFSNVAEKVAKEFGQTESKSLGKDRRGKEKIKSLSNSKSQIRKFYDEVLRNKVIIESMSSSQDSGSKEEYETIVEREFKKRLPYIKMLKAKVTYAYEREKITSNFKKFIEENIDSIGDWEDFKVFCDFFEAVVAYSAAYVKKDN